MNFKVNVLIVIVCGLMSIGLAYADRLPYSAVPYLNTFEDEKENSQWVLNPNAETNNKWCIGSATSYTDSKSLYISSNGVSATYDTSVKNVVIAYREVQLSQGQYTFAFDWKGSTGSENNYLRVFLTNDEDELKCTSNDKEKSTILDKISQKDTACLMGMKDKLVDSEGWSHVRSTFTILSSIENVKKTNRHLYIVFLWRSTDNSISNPQSIAIDNIQITRKLNIGVPQFTDLEYDEGNAKVFWSGTTADKYDVLYRELNDASVWYEAKTDTLPLTIDNIKQGAYEFWIRGVVGQDTSDYRYMLPVFVYSVDCFDALNMRNCTFSSGNYTVGRVMTETSTQRIDYGYASRLSRHTTHYIKDEIDVRTLNSYEDDGTPVAPLKTVPDGYVGSVRVANWGESGSKYARMTFQHTVESASHAVLLIGYAIVMQEIDHSESHQGRMIVSAYDENGVMIHGDCGQADFHIPGAEDRGSDYEKLWHKAYAGKSFSSTVSVYWQDWRWVGLNLDDLVGQTITISIEAMGCTDGGHYGYGYYVLQCISSEMDGIPWGEGSSTTSFTAPSGFDYKWYLKENYYEADGVTVRQDDDPQKKTIDNVPPVLPYVDPANKLTVDENDPADYICEIIYPTNSANCNYTMEATARPHTPKAEIQWDWVPSNCENRIIVKNTSHVVLTNQTTGEEEHRYDLTLPNAIWTLPDGSTTTDLHYDSETEHWYFDIPNEGQTLTFSLRASIWVQGEEYADSIVYDIQVPPIGKVDTYLFDTICEGTDYWWKDVQRNYTVEYRNDTTFEFLYTDEKAWTGCDSIVHMMLFVNATKYVTAFDTICDGESYLFGEGLDAIPYKNTTQVTKLFHSAITGCDSIVTLNLFKLPVFTASVQAELICADGDYLIIDVSDQQFVDKYAVKIADVDMQEFNGRNAGEDIEYPLSLLHPAHYEGTVEVYTPFCEPIALPIEFDVNFSSSVIQIKWDNVLAILNDKYNGGYSFRSYQWYKDGQAIKGATGSYYHTEKSLTEDAEYSVDVVLKDGTPLKICPIVYRTIVEDDTDMQTVRKIIENGNVYIIRGDEKYNIFGLKVE